MMYRLENAEQRNYEHPDTFHIPTKQEVMSVRVGDHVQLAFLFDGEQFGGERMWVHVTAQSKESRWVGVLVNTPLVVEDLQRGDLVFFHPWNVINIDKE